MKVIGDPLALVSSAPLPQRIAQKPVAAPAPPPGVCTDGVHASRIRPPTPGEISARNAAAYGRLNTGETTDDEPARGVGGRTPDPVLQGQPEQVDVAAFGFTTSTAKKVVNLSALTPVTTLYTPTDGALTPNTVKDGVIGPLWRVKYTTAGTYAGGTRLRVDASFKQAVIR